MTETADDALIRRLSKEVLHRIDSSDLIGKVEKATSVAISSAIAPLATRQVAIETETNQSIESLANSVRSLAILIDKPAGNALQSINNISSPSSISSDCSDEIISHSRKTIGVRDIGAGGAGAPPGV